MATKVQPMTGAPGEAKPATTLSNEEILRYSRHLIMPEVGMEGQLKLKNSKVLLIGTGGLGAPLGLYLAAAGVGRLRQVWFLPALKAECWACSPESLARFKPWKRSSSFSAAATALPGDCFSS